MYLDVLMTIDVRDSQSTSIVAGVAPRLTWQMKYVWYTCNLCIAGVTILYCLPLLPVPI